MGQVTLTTATTNPSLPYFSSSFSFFLNTYHKHNIVAEMTFAFELLRSSVLRYHGRDVPHHLQTAKFCVIAVCACAVVVSRKRKKKVMMQAQFLRGEIVLLMCMFKTT